MYDREGAMSPKRLAYVCVLTFTIFLMWSVGSVLLGAYHAETIREWAVRASTVWYVPVVRAVDGDTIRVRTWFGREYSVRLLGIDTPESVDPRRGPECFGKEASDRTAELTDRRYVKLEFDDSQGIFDDSRSERLVAYVFFFDGEMLNLNLVREGFAEEWTYNKRRYAHQTAFRNAEKEAMKRRLGRWATCGLESKKH